MIKLINEKLPDNDSTRSLLSELKRAEIVEPEKITDAMAEVMALDIAKKIETELEYPGQIKVTVVREMRVSEYAK